MHSLTHSLTHTHTYSYCTLYTHTRTHTCMLSHIHSHTREHTTVKRMERRRRGETAPHVCVTEWERAGGDARRTEERREGELDGWTEGVRETRREGCGACGGATPDDREREGGRVVRVWTTRVVRVRTTWSGERAGGAGERGRESKSADRRLSGRRWRRTEGGGEEETDGTTRETTWSRCGGVRERTTEGGRAESAYENERAWSLPPPCVSDCGCVKKKWTTKTNTKKLIHKQIQKQQQTRSDVNIINSKTKQQTANSTQPKPCNKSHHEKTNTKTNEIQQQKQIRTKTKSNKTINNVNTQK